MVAFVVIAQSPFLGHRGVHVHGRLGGYYQHTTLVRSAPTWDMSGPKRTVTQWRCSTETLVCAVLARVPEVSPNCHQQPTIATSSNL
jgi:hypothetical protein